MSSIRDESAVGDLIDNGNFFKLLEAETGQLLISSISVGMTNRIDVWTSNYHLSEVDHKIVEGSNFYLCRKLQKQSDFDLTFLLDISVQDVNC